MEKKSLLHILLLLGVLSVLLTACDQGQQQSDMTQTAQAALMHAWATGAAATATAQTVVLATAQAEATFSAATLEAARQAQQGDFTVQEFNGVPMVRVPAGCFTMGTDDAQAEYAIEELDEVSDVVNAELPAHEVCFEEPFWNDQYEVTNAQFALFGGQAESPSHFSGDNRPREMVGWLEARDFCALREARLPTEAEWEFAARGPDNRVFPWGDTWEPDSVVWGGNSNIETADVGSRIGGVSWVGAYDMAGNVAEWTHSLYEPYPYNANDGREEEAVDNTALRVLRGGAWAALGYGHADDQRATRRITDDAVGGTSEYGFRCARSE